MKKKILIFITMILLSFLLNQCIMIQVEDQNSIRPNFDFEKTYFLKHMPLYFMAYYNVWKYEPVDVLEFTSIKELKKSKLFVARQQITLVGNNFFIEDRVNSKKYELKEEFLNNNKEIINYSIYQEKNLIGTINQLDIYNTFLFEFIYNGNNYVIQGRINKFSDRIHSFVFDIKDINSGSTLGSIYKQYTYFKNEYEIIINREYEIIEDPIFICFGVFIDQLLKENGYQYVGSTPQSEIKSSNKKNLEYIENNLLVKKEEKITIKENIENIEKIEELKKAKEGDIITFNNIIFYPNSDKLKPESLPLIQDIANVLLERTDINVEIIGHTNDVKNPAGELELSKKRAQMVQRYLMDLGITAKRMKSYGYGSLYTKTNTIEESNRKVEIKIVSKNAN